MVRADHVLAVAPLDDVSLWARTDLLVSVLIAVGAVLLARLAGFVGDIVTAGIDARATSGDTLVRSESAKHRHAVTQVLTWGVVVVIYIAAVFLILTRLGVSTAGFVAPATVAGVALGFGAQRVVQDVLAGFFLITERQYGYGDVVTLSVLGASTPRTGTVEDLTLRVTTMRTVDGNVVVTPNGQIVQVVNLSRDWARAVIDVPITAGTDVNRANEVLHETCAAFYDDERMRPLMLDPPSVMGVESLEVGQLNMQVVARTLPGRQFEVARALRARIAADFLAAHLESAAAVAVDATEGADTR